MWGGKVHCTRWLWVVSIEHGTSTSHGISPRLICTLSSHPTHLIPSHLISPHLMSLRSSSQSFWTHLFPTQSDPILLNASLSCPILLNSFLFDPILLNPSRSDPILSTPLFPLQSFQLISYPVQTFSTHLFPIRSFSTHLFPIQSFPQLFSFRPSPSQLVSFWTFSTYLILFLCYWMSIARKFLHLKLLWWAITLLVACVYCIYPENSKYNVLTVYTCTLHNSYK